MARTSQDQNDPADAPVEDTGPANDGTPEDGTANATPSEVSGDGEAQTAFLEAHDKGYLGESPEREKTGLADKGLSQQSILKDK